MYVIAHRGANRLAPQNTIPAFEKAVELGVDGFENDVRLTSDGVVVICHNDTVDATSDGSGKISDYTFEELRKLDFGSYFDKGFAGTKIPTLEEFLQVAKADCIKIINIEIKSQGSKNRQITEKVIEQCKSQKLYDRLIISSFDTDVLITAKELGARTALLVGPNDELTEMCINNLSQVVADLKIDALHAHFLTVDENMVSECKRLNIMLNPWTVNYDDALLYMKELGVTSVITDESANALKLLK